MNDAIQALTVLAFYALLFPLSDCFATIYSRGRPPSGGEINVGRWIGWAEGVIVLTLMLLEAYTALGLVLAAKGLIRWENVKKEPHYIALGTIVNFACAIAVGGILLWIVKNGHYSFGIWAGLVMLVLSTIILIILKPKKGRERSGEENDDQFEAQDLD